MSLSYGLQIELPLIQEDAPKIEWEFQAVCLECEEFFGKNAVIWTLPWKKGVTENLLRYALKECKTRQKPFVRYFLKIVHNKLK